MAKETRKKDFVKKTYQCRHCDGMAKLHITRSSKFKDLGNGPGTPKELIVTYGVYKCPKCSKHTTALPPEVMHNGARLGVTNRVRNKALDYVFEKGLPQVDTLRDLMWRYGVSIPATTLNEWVKSERKRRETNES